MKQEPKEGSSDFDLSGLVTLAFYIPVCLLFAFITAYFSYGFLFCIFVPPQRLLETHFSMMPPLIGVTLAFIGKVAQLRATSPSWRVTAQSGLIFIEKVWHRLIYAMIASILLSLAAFSMVSSR